MLKLIALFILIWIFFKAIGMIIKTLIGSDTNKSTRYTSPRPKQHGNINIEYDPKGKKDNGYKGGDYVDYEEVE